MLQLVFSVIGLFVFYLIIRKAVMHGVLDADDARAERERAARSAE